MRKVQKVTKRLRSGAKKRVARLYYFDQGTVQQIEFLGALFGGKERGIAAAIDMAAKVLNGEASDLQISIK